MNLKQLKEKYKNSKPDSILETGIALTVKIQKAVNLYEIVLEDDSGTLEAAAINTGVFKILKEKAQTDNSVTVKGFLTKTEFETLGFEVEEVTEMTG